MLSMLVGALSVLWLAQAACASVEAPRITQSELAQPLPLPYDANADATQQVDAALAKAKRNGKRVLIDLGGNWCADCRIFAATMALPELQPFVAAHFEVVVVDVDRFNKNLQVPARFGIKKLGAAPTLLVVSPGGKLLNGDDLIALRDARSMSSQAIADWLAQWAAPVAKNRKQAGKTAKSV